MMENFIRLLDICRHYCNIGIGIQFDMTNVVFAEDLERCDIYSIDRTLDFLKDANELLLDDEVQKVIDRLETYMLPYRR